MAEVSVVPLSSRPSIAPVLPTDEIVLSRDGVALLRATIATLFASPDLSGNPTAPTQSPGNSSTRLANTAFVQSAVDASAQVLQSEIDTNAQTALSLLSALTADNSTVANSGSAETTLRAVAVPADWLNVSGQSLEGRETIEWANNANAKVLRVKFGAVGTESTIYTGNITPSASGSARISYVIQRTSASTARCDVSVSSDDSGLKRHAYIEISVDLTAATQLLVTGQGVASSDISALLSKAGYGAVT